jgi:hypothetical protein
MSDGYKRQTMILANEEENVAEILLSLNVLHVFYEFFPFYLVHCFVLLMSITGIHIITAAAYISIIEDW